MTTQTLTHTVISKETLPTGHYFQVIQHSQSSTFSGLLFTSNGGFICESQRVSAHAFRKYSEEKAISNATFFARETLKNGIEFNCSKFN